MMQARARNRPLVLCGIQRPLTWCAHVEPWSHFACSSGDQRIVAAHVREDVAEAALELDFHSALELLDIESRSGPVDPDLLTDLARLVRGEAAPCRHAPSFSIEDLVASQLNLATRWTLGTSHRVSRRASV
jgi:hypothetical protein